MPGMCMSMLYVTARLKLKVSEMELWYVNGHIVRPSHRWFCDTGGTYLQLLKFVRTMMNLTCMKKRAWIET